MPIIDKPYALHISTQNEEKNVLTAVRVLLGTT